MTPSLHKNTSGHLRQELFARVPGLESMDALMGSTTDLVFCIKNRRGQYVAANAAFLRRTRFEYLGELVGRTAREVFPGPLAYGYEQQDEQVFSTGEPVRERLEMVTNPDGGRGWYIADKVPVRDATGEIVALAGISRDLHASAADKRLGPLASAVAQIRRNFAQPLRINTIASEAGMSLSRFERLMRAVLHVSPRELLTRLRVESAAHQLRTTSKSLIDIALDGGFCDQPTFCRQFKSAMGTSPRRYRQAGP